MATQNFRVKNGLEVGIGATILVAKNNGNIGINSTAPTQKLDVAGTAKIEGLIFGSGTEVTSVDADLNAVSASHDTLASAKAIKSYVDQQITAEDLDFSGDSGTGSVDLDSQSLSISGTSNEIETSASGQTLTIGLPDKVSIASTLTVASSTTINSSGIDISTNLTVDGLSDLDELNVAGLSTFASNVDINAGLDVDGHTELDNLNVSGVSTFQGNINLGDNDQIVFGDGNDLFISSNGSNGIIRTGSGSNLIYRSASHKFRNQAGTEELAVFTENGSVDLYYDNSKKFETTDAGVIITGIATATTFSGSGASLTNIPNGALDNSSVNFGGVTLSLGQSDTTPAFDLQDATNYPYSSLTGISTEIVHDTTPQLGGNLDLNSNDITGTGNIDITGISTSTGIDVTGHTETDTLNVSGVSTFVGDVSFGSTVTFGDNDKIILGDGGFEFQIYHNGSKSIIRDNGPGDLLLGSNGTAIKLTKGLDSEDLAIFNTDGSVELFYDDSKKFETVGTGVSISSGTASTATIYGPGNLIIDPAPIDDNGGIVRIKGDLYVDGTTTEINSTTLTIDDLNIVVASGATNSTAADGAGITVDGASATLQYATSGDKWVFNKAPYYNANRLLTTADEGSGNGIDADTLDGQEGTYYLDYANFSGIATDSDKLDGQQGTYYLDYANFSGIATDSDKLDGQQGTYYLNTSATSQTKTGDLIINGNLGLGTSPSQKLDVNGAVRLRGAVYDNNNSVGTSSKVLKSTGSGVEWGSLADLGGISGVTIADDNSSTSVFNIAFTDSSGTSITELDVSSSNLTYKPEGKLGIGTNNPSVTLDVNGDLTVSGVSTFSDDLIVGTATTGVVARTDGTLNVSGVSTFQNNVHLLDDDKLLLGGSSGTHDGLEIYHNGSHSYIDDSGTGNLYLRSGTLSIQNLAGSKTSAVFNSGSSQELYYDNSKKFETTGAGVTITGITTSTGFRSLGGTFDASSLGGGNDSVTNAALVMDRGNTIYVQASGYLRKVVESDGTELNIGQQGTAHITEINVRPGTTGGQVKLHAGSNSDNVKLETTSTGIDVTGHTETDTLNVSGIATATTFSGSGASLNSIPNSALDNSSVNFGGVTLSLGATDSTPAFDLSDATNYPTSSLTGTITNDQLAGSIANGKLVNSSVNFGGVTVSLGATDSTPAFDLSDATNYPYTSLTGISTEILYDTTPQLGGDLDLNSKLINGTGGINVTGIVTATSFVGPITGTASSATQLENARNFSITGDFITASNVSFNGTSDVGLSATITTNSITLGTYTSGDYVASISGTANQIAVDVTSGEGTTPVISIPNNPTLPGTTVTIENDLQVNRDLNVNGNITIGGTSATLFTETLKISDPDIIVGFRTDASGNDISNDTTASHGGIAIASTEGTPLITLVNPGAGETFPATYKKIMWFEQGSFAGLGTDAWLINYGVGIGSTQVPNNVVLAAGDVHITNNDIKKVRDINSSGIITATSFVGSGASLNSIPNSALDNSSVNFGGVTIALGATDLTPAFDLQDATNYPYTSLTGISTEIVHDTTPQLGGNLDLNSKNITGTGNMNVTGIVTATTFSGAADFTGIVTAGSFSGSGASLTNIPNSALTNSSIAIGGITFNLGDTDATPAFDLSDATNYPYTSLTGISTEILYDTTPQLGGNLDLNSKLINGTGGINITGVVTATSFNGIIEVSTDTSPQLGGDLNVNGRNINFGDSASASDDRLNFGAGTDLSIYFDGTNSYIDVNPDAANNLYIRNNVGSDQNGDIYIQAKSGEQSIICYDDSTVELYYDNVWRLTTSSTGVSVNGVGIGTWKATDNRHLIAGTGDDFKIYHDGSSTYLDNDTGHIYIRNSGANDDSNIYIQAVDGEQSIICYDDSTVELYYDNTWRLYTTATGVSVNGTGLANASGGGWKAGDGAYLTAGDGDDLKIYHDGNHSYIDADPDADNQHLYIRNNVTTDHGGNIYLQAKSGEQSIVCYDDSSVELYFNNTWRFATSSTGVSVNGVGIGTWKANDNNYLTAGTGDDFQIYHDGSSTYLDNDTGNIYIRNNVASDVNGDIYIQAKSGENSIICYDDSAVELYFNNSVKFYTTTGGVNVTGQTDTDTLYVSETLNVSGISTFQSDVHLGDNDKLHFGTGDDLHIYHTGTTSYIDNDTGHLLIRNNVAANVGGDIYIQAKSTENSIACRDNAEVELYYDGVQKFETTGYGVTISGGMNVSGITTADGFSLVDSKYFSAGTDDDFQIYHNGTNTYLDNDNGHLVLRNNVDGSGAPGDIYIQAQSTENSIACRDNAEVELYYNGVQKFETTGYGVTISGGMNVSGVTTSTDFNTTSDQNLKTNIQTIEDPLEKIVQIRGVNFEWKENNKPSAGVIAQEIEKVLPQLVNGSDTKTVNYNGLIGLLIETVKEQQKQIDNLNTRLSKLE